MSYTFDRMKMMIFAFMLAFVCGIFSSTSMAAENHVAIANGGFRMLKQHSEWIQNARFGRMWRPPHVISGWHPIRIR